MTSKHDNLRSFRSAYLDYLEGARNEPPVVEDLPAAQRRAARAFIESITAARGVDPYASRPSIEQLLARPRQTGDRVRDLADMLRDHLRTAVDSRALVTADVAATAAGLASAWVIQARGMRLRIVPEMESSELGYTITKRAEDIAQVFSAFPDSHAVLYATIGERPLGAVVDRGDVSNAIETPSGQRRAPSLRRTVVDAATACEEWFTGMIPELGPASAPVELPTTPEPVLDPLHLAKEVVREVSAAGLRARIEAKRDSWGAFGAQEAQQLAVIVEAAQDQPLPEAVYRVHVDKLVEIAA